MSTTNNKILNVLKRKGTDQLDRHQDVLQPESVKLHGFDVEEWMRFAYDFAKKINYFSITDTDTPSATWESFFAQESDLKAFMEKVKAPDGTMTPHLTLFVCFLQLLELSTARLNRVTKRHLDFYYREVLKIEALPEESDKVYLLFELAKGINSFLVEEGTELDGGKDLLNKKRIYTLTEELPASRTTVAEIRNVYNEHSIVDEADMKDEDRYSIKAAPVANSLDGIGKALKEDAPTWYPFGYYSHTSEGVNDPLQEELPEMVELPDARLGFGIASPVLRLAEGERTIVARLTYDSNVTTDLDGYDLRDTFEIFLTGEKGWLGPFEMTVTTTQTTDTRISAKEVFFSVKLDPDVPAVTDYNAAVHGEQYAASAPVMRFLAATNSETGYGVYSLLAGKNDLKSASVVVDVSGVTTLTLESDAGTLNAEKPFYPFTTQPVKGSGFSVYNEEAFDKKWTKMSVKLKWKSTPIDFKLHYAVYDSSFLAGITKQKYTQMFQDYDPNAQYEAYFSLLESFGYQKPLSYTLNGKVKEDDNDTVYKPIVTGNGYFKVYTEVFYKEVWQSKKNNQTLFKQNSDGSFYSEFAFDGQSYESGQAGPLRIRLEQSFLHEMFPTLYAIALSSQDVKMPIPKEPYTPFGEEIELSYTAIDTAVINTADQVAFEDRTLQLFHEHPYGQSEEHTYLRTTFADVLTKCTLLPVYCKGGEMYIGLKDAQLSELVTLLFQVSEGTENPLAKTFLKGQKIQWDILCNNVWRSLESLIVLNETDNLLLSGRIKFTIPDYANSDNTLLPSGLFWIRAKMFKRYDAVCRLFGIHAQVAVAEFENRENEVSHLANGLPAGSISKLIERLSQVKSIQQPYATFDGKLPESDPLYYRRVSERLRHKNRAITLWDYEHLVLEKFPQIYKIKCLNHTSGEDYLAPGCVSLVVIPDTINKTVFDIYQPRVSRGLLNKIRDYIGELTSMHVELEVVNPNYEEVQIELAVQFYSGLDINTYKAKLNEDITRYLSPWAFEDARSVQFGTMLYRSALIHYIEKLSYVDFIQDVRIFREGELQPRNCEPSTPKSILVSAQTHLISTNVKSCQVQSSTETTEACQL